MQVDRSVEVFEGQAQPKENLPLARVALELAVRHADDKLRAPRTSLLLPLDLHTVAGLLEDCLDTTSAFRVMLINELGLRLRFHALEVGKVAEQTPFDRAEEAALPRPLVSKRE